MKFSITVLLFFLSKIISAQEVINPYINYDYSQFGNYPDWPLKNINVGGLSYSHYTANQNPSYTGEYEIDIETLQNNTWFNSFPYLAKSYQIEAVSFPFTMPCAFDPAACADGTSIRNLYMPNDPRDPGTGNWGYLTREMQFKGIFDYIQTTFPATHQDLISYAFTKHLATPTPSGRSYFPHTILKHTINIHCGPLESQDVVASISWYYDNTRGRMRYYPFEDTNVSSGPVNYDIIIFPEFLNPHTNYGNSIANHIENYSTLNYFPYNEITNPSNCQLAGAQPPTTANNFGSYVYPNDYLLVSAPPRSWRGNFLAGYHYDNYTGINADEATLLGGVKHNYFINKGWPDLDLNWINPSEKIIFNPSEVSVISQSTEPTILKFPSGYTFKTILGVYPSVQEANAANTAANGGPYSDLRKVPVTVNASQLMPLGGTQTDYPEVSWDDPTTSDLDERYGYYYIENLGQITVEPCVKIFDAKFEVKQGGTLVFEDYTQTINPDRFTITGTGGAIAKNFLDIQYLQNTKVTQPQHIPYKAVHAIYAGSDVDPKVGATIAPYILEPGSDVEFVAADKINLNYGFGAKQGSLFHAHCGSMVKPVCPNNWAGARRGNNSTEESTAKPGLTISPNPVKDHVLIHNDNILTGTLEIIDIMGRKLIKQAFNTHAELNVSGYGAGIYFARVIDEKGNSFNGNIIKQ